MRERIVRESVAHEIGTGNTEGEGMPKYRERVHTDPTILAASR